MKIVIASAFSRNRPGGTWYRMQIARGFEKLGHDVYLVEELEPGSCVDQFRRKCQLENSIQYAAFKNTMYDFGVADKSSQIYEGGQSSLDPSWKDLIARAKQTDLLINMSGNVKAESVLSNVRRRAYVDDDPVYTQLWHAEHGKDLNLTAHDIFFSRGLNIGTSYSDIPDCGIRWHPFLPPIIFDDWSNHFQSSSKRFTTISSWKRSRSVRYHGEPYSSKVTEFQRYAGLPERTKQDFEIALKQYIESDETFLLLKSKGWILSRAKEMITDLETYQQFIQRSRAEICIATNAYVKGNSGWFSERSSHYLASGKPVLAQSTGLERSLPTGGGLLTFRTIQEAVSGVESIHRDYEKHCRMAREFAEEFLDYRKILPGMLEICST